MPHIEYMMGFNMYMLQLIKLFTVSEQKYKRIFDQIKQDFMDNAGERDEKIAKLDKECVVMKVRIAELEERK